MEQDDYMKIVIIDSIFSWHVENIDIIIGM